MMKMETDKIVDETNTNSSTQVIMTKYLLLVYFALIYFDSPEKIKNNIK